MNLSKRLVELRIKNGYTQAKVVEYLKEKGSPITESSLSRWESGQFKPSVEQFFLLCEIYGVDDIKQAFTGASVIEKDLLSGLNYSGRKHAERYIDFLREDPLFSGMEAPRIQHRYLKLYDLPVSAGGGEYLDSDSYEEIMVDDTVPDTAEYALRISGDSMTPRFIDGQIVFVKPQQWLDPGEIGIFAYEGDGYIKKYAGNKLVSLNSNYKPIVIRDWDSFRIYGKVVG